MSIRLFRQASDAAKTKMSQAHIGKTHSEQTKQRISQSMKNYWQGIPNRDEHTTMDELLGVVYKKKGAARQPPKK